MQSLKVFMLTHTHLHAFQNNQRGSPDSIHVASLNTQLNLNFHIHVGYYDIYKLNL